MPSFHPADVVIGIVGAIAVRLIIYFKGKNAKKYRQGMEYGSARWGTPQDIKPYMDDEADNNIILTETERLTMSSRPNTILLSKIKKSMKEEVKKNEFIERKI